MDQSAECSFSERSRYKHFLITILSITPDDLKKLKSRLKKQIGKWICDGWNKDAEPKAFELYKNKKFGSKAMESVLNKLTDIPSLEISYIIINKQKIKHEAFRNASYGTAYNYFTGILLSHLVFDDGFTEFYLIYDRRNKETHENKHFREYLETKLLGTALEKEIDVKHKIEGYNSSTSYGLLAVDYFSWSIFRMFEHADSRFYKVFEKKLKRRREWYIQ